MGLKVVSRSWYFGGFIRDRAAEKRWLAGKVEGCAESIGTLAGYPTRTQSPHIPGYRSHSSRSEHSCSGSPLA